MVREIIRQKKNDMLCRYWLRLKLSNEVYSWELEGLKGPSHSTPKIKRSHFQVRASLHNIKKQNGAWENAFERNPPRSLNALMQFSNGCRKSRVFVKVWNSQGNCCYDMDQNWGQSPHLGTQCLVGVGVRWGQFPCGYTGPPPKLFFYILRPRGCILDKFWPIWLSVLALLRKAFAA